MIKEKKKKSKYDYSKSKSQILKEYLRTIFLSILVALIITLLLANHARNEMIKNLYTSPEEKSSFDRKIAQELIVQSDFMKDLRSKSYTVCMHAGDLYETVEDYKNAQIAFELAVEKAKPGNFKPYYKLVCTLISQEKFAEAQAILKNTKDYQDKNLIKFKTRSYIVMGDKYYSIGKFLSAAKSYEKADFYYNKFSKKDSHITNSIKSRIINSYLEVADIMVKTKLNSDAVRYLNKALKYDPNNNKIKYKLAIIYSDLDPEKSVEILEELLKICPQDIDYNVYGTALMKSANIADLDNRPTKAKYYRYKIHSIDLFLNRKVIYKNDIATGIISFPIKKVFFTYPLKAVYSFQNISNNDITNLKADFVLCQDDKEIETFSAIVADKNSPMIPYESDTSNIAIKFKHKIFSKKDLENYTIKIYLYKDEKFKTLICETRVPTKPILPLPME